jgi:hypothetical protein
MNAKTMLEIWTEAESCPYARAMWLAFIQVNRRRALAHMPAREALRILP